MWVIQFWIILQPFKSLISICPMWQKKGECTNLRIENRQIDNEDLTNQLMFVVQVCRDIKERVARQECRPVTSQQCRKVNLLFLKCQVQLCIDDVF